MISESRAIKKNMRTTPFRKMSVSIPENKTPVTDAALERKLNSSRQRLGSLHLESEDMPWKKSSTSSTFNKYGNSKNPQFF
ncbi:MAG: hypothetical protein QM426_07070 [Euryarchaeota archaeon]|nr:hypothetical protein [Euryarchaeota archaeon]